MALFSNKKRNVAGGGAGMKFGMQKMTKTAVIVAAALISCATSYTLYSNAADGGGSGTSSGGQLATGVQHHVVWSDGGTVDSNGNFIPSGATGDASIDEWLNKWGDVEGYHLNGNETDSTGGKHIDVFKTAARQAIDNATRRTGLGAQHIRIVGMGWYSCALSPYGRGFVAKKPKATVLDRQGTDGELPGTTTDGTQLWTSDMRTHVYQQALDDSMSNCSIIIAAVADTEIPGTVPVAFQKQGDPSTISSENEWGDKGVKVPASQMKDQYSYEGAVYGVYKDEACTQWVEDLTIGADGMTTAQMLRGTTYFLKEKTAPKGWALSGDVQQIDTGNGTTVTLNEQPNYGRLSIRKLDKNNGKQPIKQAGFVFTLTNDSTQESWTQKNGWTRTNNI